MPNNAPQGNGDIALALEIGSQLTVGASSDAQAATGGAPAGLPLRQNPRRNPIGEPKITDVTEKFRKACNALHVGQLVKDEQFTLFESIGAIEIMDPKMDSGFLQPGETAEEDYDTLAPVLPEELLSIMDQLLCYEMAWHTGYPLSQTLFTSVYIDKLLWPEPATLQDTQFFRGQLDDSKRPDVWLEALRAYCLALVKGCDFVIARFRTRDYFEEEDFCTHTYNRILLTDVPLDVICREVDAAVERVQEPEILANNAIRAAIVARLEFRKSLLRAFDTDIPLEQAAHSWPLVQSYISTLKATNQLGQTVPGAFSTKIQRRLASTVPPRPIVELAFPDAIDKLQQLCFDCNEAARFANLPADPMEHQSFLWYFAARQPPPLAYARIYIAPNFSTPQSPDSLLLIDVETLVLLSSPIIDRINWSASPPRNPLLPRPPRIQFALLMDEFADRAAQPYFDFWIALTQNRCRLRRMLTHVVQAWDVLQADAGLVDSDLQVAATQLGVAEQVMDFPLATWTYVRKLWMMEQIVLLGFEQDVYLPDEFAMMYLFLSLLATRRLELLERINAHRTLRASQLLTARDLRAAQKLTDAVPQLASAMAHATGTAALAAALSRFYIVLLYLRLLPFPARPFSTPALCYELRMKSFLTLSPPEVPPFADIDTHLHPYGPYDAPSEKFWTDTQDPKSVLWADLDVELRRAREAWGRVKRLGAEAARAGGVKEAWESAGKGVGASCVALGVGVMGVRDACGKSGGGGVGEMGIKVDVPAAGVRYAEAWVVGKIIKP